MSLAERALPSASLGNTIPRTTEESCILPPRILTTRIESHVKFLGFLGITCPTASVTSLVSRSSYPYCSILDDEDDTINDYLLASSRSQV